MLQNLFQSFFIVAEKPKLGLFVTVGAGVTNIILDALLVGVFPFGLEGAAIATSASQFIGAAVPVLYFARKNDSLLKLGKTRIYPSALLKAITNGSSELMSNISSSVVTMLYNMQLMSYAGEDGVAAYGAIMYLSFSFISIFIGYAVGTAPLVGYNYGAQNIKELKNLLKKSTVVCFAAGAFMTLISSIFAKPLAGIFVSYDAALWEMTVRGLKVFSLSFLLSGFCIYASSFFTALNNGPVSAAISFMRTLVFQALGILLLPLAFGLDGIWYSMLIAETLTITTTLIFLFALRKRYKYF